MKYPKIQTIWKRDEKNKFNILEGQYSKDEFRTIKDWYVTEKIDGTNIRIFFDGIKVRFGGRTDNAQVPTFLFDYLQNKFTPELLGKVFDDNKDIKHTFPKIVLFGEGYGNKIQSRGKKYRDDVSLILFDVYVDGWWLTQDNVKDIAKKLEIDSVPCLGIMTKEEAIRLIKDTFKSKISKDKELIAEGIVARSHPLMLFRDKEPIMWKLKVRDYGR